MSDPLSPEARHVKRKKDKVRSAWIAFIGRIVAQVVGAIASVTLGLIVLSRYHIQEKASATVDSPVTAVATPSAATPSAAAPSTSDHLARHRASRASGALALAVMPLQDFSKGAAHTYFADGVTEALITELAQVKGLQVTSRTSSMAYKATTKSLPEIARELGVDLILEGSVVQDQAQVRVTAQLIDADTDQHLWARSYDRPLRNLLPVQAEVAKRIVADIKIPLLPLISSAGQAQAPAPVKTAFRR
jgi:TolB-like protein